MVTRVVCVMLWLGYVSVYYYFAPFLVNFIPYVWPGGYEVGGH
jgi:hypothetical protein